VGSYSESEIMKLRLFLEHISLLPTLLLNDLKTEMRRISSKHLLYLHYIKIYEKT
jgi:hypothetical protein